MSLVYMIASDHTRLRQSPALIDDVTGQITGVVLTPTAQAHLASKEFVDVSFSAMAPKNLILTAQGTYVTREEVGALDVEIAMLASTAEVTALTNALVKLTGSTVTGPISYSGVPQTPDELINKDYIDDISALIPADLLTQAVADTRYLSQSGGTMTGPLLVSGDPPTAPLTIINKTYADNKLPAFTDVLRRSGGTMTGRLLADRMPVHPSELAPKLYVDLWNNFLQAPIQPYITSGAIIGVLHPFLGTVDSSGKLTALKNVVPGHTEFDMLPSGEPLAMAGGMWWSPTATSGMGFRLRASILSNRIIIGAKDDPSTNATSGAGLGYAYMDDGLAYFEYRREYSGNNVNIGARFRYHAADDTNLEVITSKRGRPAANSVHTHEFFRNAGDDVTGARVWDYAMNNLDVNGNPGLNQPDGFIQYFGNRAETAQPFPGKIGPIIVVKSSAPDMAAARTAAVNWILGLQSLFPLA